MAAARRPEKAPDSAAAQGKYAIREAMSRGMYHAEVRYTAPGKKPALALHQHDSTSLH